MITGKVSIEDFIAAQRLHVRPTLRRQRVVLAVLAVIGLIVALAGYVFIGIVIVGAGAGGLIGQFVDIRFLFPRRLTRLYNQQAALRSDFHYSWDAEHISSESSSGSSKRPWVDYVKSKENEQLFLLYQADNLFEVIPKSWFRDPELVTSFRQLASRAGT